MEESIRLCIEAVRAFFSPMPWKTKGENEWRSAFVFKAATDMLENQNRVIYLFFQMGESVCSWIEAVRSFSCLMLSEGKGEDECESSFVRRSRNLYVEQTKCI